MDRADTAAIPTFVDVGVFRAELLAVVRALEECQPCRVVSDCKGVVKALQAIQNGHRLPKGRHRDLEERARRALTQDPPNT
eukprot:6114572-Amphidinium_carterae.1